MPEEEAKWWNERQMYGKSWAARGKRQHLSLSLSLVSSFALSPNDRRRKRFTSVFNPAKTTLNTMSNAEDWARSIRAISLMYYGNCRNHCIGRFISHITLALLSGSDVWLSAPSLFLLQISIISLTFCNIITGSVCFWSIYILFQAHASLDICFVFKGWIKTFQLKTALFHSLLSRTHSCFLARHSQQNTQQHPP